MGFPKFRVVTGLFGVDIVPGRVLGFVGQIEGVGRQRSHIGVVFFAGQSPGAERGFLQFAELFAGVVGGAKRGLGVAFHGRDLLRCFLRAFRDAGRVSAGSPPSHRQAERS